MDCCLIRTKDTDSCVGKDRHDLAVADYAVA